MTAEAHTPAHEEESADFKRMRAFDREWSGPRLILHGSIWLAIAIVVIYTLAYTSQSKNEVTGGHALGITVP
jgi:hypothetical protein